MTGPLVLKAPLDGWCDSLAAAPDEVFASGMMGEGITIDPTSSTVLAPCDGTIVSIPTTCHAVSLKTPCGVEILIHVGIDTVRLRGAGLTAHVEQGARVVAGDRLLSIDLESVVRGATSLVTPIVVTALAGRAISGRRSAGPIRAGEVLLTLGPASSRARTAPGATGLPSVEERHRIALAHGLHARPAALLAQGLKGLEAEVAIAFGERAANPRSIVALMALGVREGDEIRVTASGRDAAAALGALRRALELAFEQEKSASHAPPPPPPSAIRAALAGDATSLGGLVAVPGFAVGRATRLERAVIDVREAGAGATHERVELDRARALVAARLRRLADVGGGPRRDILAAHLEFLDDPELDRAARAAIDAGKSAGYAWRAAVQASIGELGRLEDARLRERIDDLRDIESHVLLALKGEARPMKVPLPDDAVLIAEDLLPSELVALDRDRLRALCLAAGGATSHVAILAAAMDVPMLIGLGPRLASVANGTALIVDAQRGRLELAPDAAALARAEAEVTRRRAAAAAERAAAQRECRTRDGTRIEVFANLGSEADAVAAVSQGAEGCGLLRTEFLFLERTLPPDEAEQRSAYQAIATVLAGRPLVLRLLDVGGDKPLSYLPLPPEENPALGLRGIRTGLARPDLLRTQLRAALSVEPAASVHLLVPMVTEAAELSAVRALIAEVSSELGRAAKVSLGAMIETPAAAATAAQLAPLVEFFSVGSNDLSQYTLAMDRGHADLAGRIDALHPAVLNLIALAAVGARAAGKPLAVCGGMAADPLAVPVLLGLGVAELSVVPARVPATKACVASLDIECCRALSREVLGLASAVAVRARVSAWLEQGAGGG